DKLEIEKLRMEGDKLVQQIKHLVKMKDSPPVLQPLDDLNDMHMELAASLEEKRLDIRRLEEELLLLSKVFGLTVDGCDAYGRYKELRIVHGGSRTTASWHVDFGTFSNSSFTTAQPMKTSYTQLGTIDAPTDCVNALAFSMNGRYLASATNDNTIRVYDVQRSFATIWEEKSHNPFTAVAWRDSTLFVGSMDGTIFCCYPTRVKAPFNDSPTLY
ncbi:hypothetical protein F5878DRAFT_648051, partial [Lentinula raphanica]